MIVVSCVDQTIEKLRCTLQGDIKGTWIPFNNTDACGSITPSCPINASTPATFDLSVPISKLFPAVSLVHIIMIYIDYSFVDQCTNKDGINRWK